MPSLFASEKGDPDVRPTGLILGLAAKKQHGKDTFADYLVMQEGFTKLSFADPMKRSAAAALGTDVETLESLKENPRARVQVIVQSPFIGQADEAIVDISVREYLQFVGTESHRMIPEFGDKVWINMMGPKVATPGRYVITDARFRNEQEEIKRLGGYIVQITRPGMPTGDNHPSELVDHGLADYHVYNDGDLVDYAVKIQGVLSDIRRARREG